MNKILCTLLISLAMISCDSVDQPKRDFNDSAKVIVESESKAIDIELTFWERFKISSQKKYFHDENRPVDKQKAEALIKTNLQGCVPEANVIILASIAAWLKNFDRGIEDIEKWLISLGLKKITFILDYKNKKTIFREYNDGEVNVIEKNDSEFANLTIEQKWDYVILSDEELNKLYEATKKESFEKLGPMLIDIVYPPQGIKLYSASPPPKWTDTTQSFRYRKERIAKEIWYAKVSNSSKDSVVETILKLLKNAKSEAQKEELVLILRFNQWNSECESVVLNIAKNSSEGYRLRNYAMLTLLKRCGLEKYIPICIELILNMKDKTRRCSLFHDITNEVKDFSKLSNENANQLIKSGFQILSELSTADLKHGYFVALTLGSYLKIKDEFMPDRNNEMYEGINHEYLFPDTVKNALNWWNQHKNEYCD